LGVNTPEVVTALQKLLQAPDSHLTIAVCSALWEIQKNKEMVTGRVMKVLESAVEQIEPAPEGPTAKVPSKDESNAIYAANVLRRFQLSDDEHLEVLTTLDRGCEKSKKSDVRLRFLNVMVDYGYDLQKAATMCVTWVKFEDAGPRCAALMLVKKIVETNATVEVNVEPFLGDNEAAVRVLAAKVYWLKTHDAKKIVPILTRASPIPQDIFRRRGRCEPHEGARLYPRRKCGRVQGYCAVSEHEAILRNR
jgi:hypothetical protein